MKTASLLIVDDHDTIVSGLKYELSQKIEISNICAAPNSEEAIHLVKTIHFDLAIIDISFKNGSNKDGIALAQSFKLQFPDVRIIMYSSYADKGHYIHQLKEIGVDAIVSKDDGNFALKTAITKILEKQIPYYSQSVEESILNSRVQKAIYISKREKDVIELLQQHLTYKQIATQLGISKNTVDFHAKNLYSKFGVHKVSELLEKVKVYL